MKYGPKCVIIILLLTGNLSPGKAWAQESPVSFYITIKFNKKCENQLQNIDNKKFCLAPQPVITLEDIIHISTLKIDLGNQSYFNMVFTEAGAAKLKNLSIAFPNTQIVLVVDRLIVGTITALETIRTNSLKMTAGFGSTANVQFVHDKLKAYLPVKN